MILRCETIMPINEKVENISGRLFYPIVNLNRAGAPEKGRGSVHVFS